jgi:hypothetical protein
MVMMIEKLRAPSKRSMTTVSQLHWHLAANFGRRNLFMGPPFFYYCMENRDALLPLKLYQSGPPAPH